MTRIIIAAVPIFMVVSPPGARPPNPVENHYTTIYNRSIDFPRESRQK
jgi:hypothetical protein